jgi:hypothetical protein
MMKHLQRNTECPYCRATLIEPVCEDSESEYESIEYDSESDNDFYEIEKLEAAFIAKGYGVKDALSIILHRFSKTDPKYTKEYIQQLENDVSDIHDELQREYDETISMASEDGYSRRRALSRT